MAYSLSPWLKPRFFITGTNRPLAGGLMYTYKAGTTDPSFDARTREINALRDLSIQRAKDIKAKKNARMVSPANAGVSALREYMKNQDEQGGQ